MIRLGKHLNSTQTSSYRGKQTLQKLWGCSSAKGLGVGLSQGCGWIAGTVQEYLELPEPVTQAEGDGCSSEQPFKPVLQHLSKTPF